MGTVCYRYRQSDEDRLREELSVAETSYGASDPQTLVILRDLAGVLTKQGRYKLAEEVIRKGLSDYPGRHESVQVLEVMDCLGKVLSYQGLYLQALQLRRRIFELKKNILGEDHLSTLISMIYVSVTCNVQG
jgi:tetratricopeptide (TPR) repeat protein